VTPQLLVSLAEMLSADPLTTDDVSSRIGPVVEDPGAPLPIVFRPTMAGVSDARLWRYPESGLPYVLKVEPSANHAPTVSDLETALGTSERVLTHRGRPDEVVFDPISRGTKWTVTAIAELESSHAAVATARVTSIRLRRDPV